MLKIGLTGGIGSGKSSVSQHFKKWGAHIFDADTVAKNILNNNEIAQNEVISEFGTDVLGANGRIDKSKLSRIVFQDEDNQLTLNTIIHPYVFTEIDKDFDLTLSKGENDIFVVDAALIYESGADTHMDYVIVVTSHLGLRVERVLARGDLSRNEFLKRVELQWSDEEKVQMADFIILNNSSEDNLLEEAKKTYDLLL
ncbi:dephospho-CoA kinase [Candidatus Marinimicrobia bacterium]|nr:dephospho-CoA kinase [Candidatus Neomarinimicrobiota bacterium]